MSTAVDRVINSHDYLLDKILKHIGNKHIYILAPSITLPDVLITAPILVRLNSSRRWGDCNIWFNNQDTEEITHLESESIYKDKFIIRANSDSDGDNLLANYPERLLGRTYFWSPSSWESMIEDIKIEHPLTGTIAAYWFHKYTQNDITLVNYDFYKIHKIHNLTRDIEPGNHQNPEQDKKFLESLPRITWNTLKT